MNTKHLKLSQLSKLTGLKRHTINARAKSLYKDKLERSSGNQLLLTPEQIREIISDKIGELSGKIIYIGNLKGGVGKTTIAYLLTEAISSLGIRTCAIDLDVQANLTQQFSAADVEQPVFFDVIDNKKKISQVIKTVSSTIDFIPSSLRNSLIQKSLSMQAPKHHLTWFNDLCIDYLRKKYEVIIVDTPPHLTTLNSVFCLCLKEFDHIVIPACSEEFSILGSEMFLDDVQAIWHSYGIKSFPEITVIINRFMQAQKNNLEMLVKIGKKYDKMLSEIIIKDTAKIREIINKKIPLGAIKQGKEVFDVLFNLLIDVHVICQSEKDERQ